MKSRGAAVTLAVVLAVAATGAIYLYVQGVRGAQAAESTHMVTVIVPKQEIAAQTDLDGLIAHESFTTLRIPSDAVVDGAVTDLSQLKGQTTRYPILAGEQITVARLQGSTLLKTGPLGLHPGYEAITLSFDLPQVVDGVIQAGDHVTMYASFSDVSVLTNNLKDLIAGKGTPTKLELGGITATVVPDVRILMVAGLAPGNGITGGGGGNGGVRVTFELTPSDAVNVLQANSGGSLWLALLPPDQKGEPLAPVNLFNVLSRRRLS